MEGAEYAVELHTNGRALIEHWDWASSKGLMNATTARIIKNASYQVLSVQPGWEDLEVETLNLEDAFRRFQNLKGKGLAPRSLQDYRRRFEQGVESFLAYIRDPAAWKGPGQDRPRRTDSTSTPRAKVTDHGSRLAVPSFDEAGLIEYPFPIRSGVTGRIELPPDLRASEAKRLCGFIMSLAIDSDALLIARD